MKFLFIPCSDLHVTLFEPLVSEISKYPEHEVAFISVDSFERRNSEKLLNKKFPFTKFGNYKPSGYLSFKKNYYNFITRTLF